MLTFKDGRLIILVIPTIFHVGQVWIQSTIIQKVVESISKYILRCLETYLFVCSPEIDLSFVTVLIIVGKSIMYSLQWAVFLVSPLAPGLPYQFCP